VFFEFSTVPIRNKNTRIAYYHAIGRFLAWCERAGFRNLEDIEPITVAAYIEQHPGSALTVKQHMAAIRMFFSYLTEKGVLAMNPAREVKTERFSLKDGKTPAFARDGSPDGIGLDRYQQRRRSPRQGASCHPCRYLQPDRRRPEPKGRRLLSERKTIRRPAPHQRRQGQGISRSSPARRYLDAYLDISGLRANPTGPLFPTTRGNSRELGSRPMTRIDAARMLKRRLAQAGITGSYSPHSFRASGLTRFLEEGGTPRGSAKHRRSRGQSDHQALRSTAANRP
jgi:integrase